MSPSDDKELWAQTESEDLEARFDALRELSRRAFDAGEYIRALTLTAAAVDVAKAIGSDRELATAWTDHGQVLWKLRRADEAASCFLAAGDLYTALGVPRDVGLSLLRVASTLCDADITAGVRGHAERAIDAFACEPFDPLLIRSLANIADKLSTRHVHADALLLVRRAQDVAERAGAQGWVEHARCHEVEALSQAGEWDAALALIPALRASARAVNDAEETVRLCGLESEILNAQERFAEAAALLNDAIVELGPHVGSRLRVQLMWLHAQVLWDLYDEPEPALAGLEATREFCYSHRHKLADAQKLMNEIDFVEAEWCHDLERWEDSEFLLWRLLSTQAGFTTQELTSRLATVLFQQDRFSETIATLDFVPDDTADDAPVGGFSWAWRRCLRLLALQRLGRWDEVAVIAEDALARCREPDRDSRLVGEMWEALAMARLEQPEETFPMIARAIAAYRADGFDERVTELLETVASIRMLIGTRRPLHPEPTTPA